MLKSTGILAVDVMKIKNKKGSHVGIIFSFIIFVSFLIFLILMIEPSINTQKSKQHIIELLKNELIKNVSSELVAYSIDIEKINGLKEEYDNVWEGYAILKDRYKIPAGSDFWFSFENEAGTKVEPDERPIPKNVDVYSEEIPVSYIEEDIIKYGFLTIKVW